MFPLPDNIHRIRWCLLFVGLHIVCFVPVMMLVGSLALSEGALLFTRIVVNGLCLAIAYVGALTAARRGRPAWLLKHPPNPPPV